MSRDLREWLEEVEANDLLERIDAEVDWDEEMAAITYMRHRERDAPALLFENVRGYPDDYRVLFNMFSSSSARLALTMNESPDASDLELIRHAREKLSASVDPEYVAPDSASVYENTQTGEDVDVTKFPAPKMWPKDGGRYIGTADATIHRDPETGILNVGTYRQMIQGEREVGLYTSPGKDLRIDMQHQWERDEPLEVAAVYGVLPELFVAGSMSPSKDESELHHAGGIRGSPIEVVEGSATDLPIPAHAEIVVEGKLYPNDMKPEGPFGEFTGYYGRPKDDTPVLSIEAVHHRDRPILTSSLMADYPGNDATYFYGLGRSAGIWNDIEDKLGIPGVTGVYCPPASMGVGMTFVSVDQQYAGHASQVASIAAQCPNGAYFSKFIVVVDDDIDVTDIDQVLWAMSTRANPEDDLDTLTDTWSTWLDPAQNPPEERPYGSKVLVDATKNHQHYDEFAERSALHEATYRHVADRWAEYGFDDEPPELPMLVEDDELRQN